MKDKGAWRLDALRPIRWENTLNPEQAHVQKYDSLIEKGSPYWQPDSSYIIINIDSLLLGARIYLLYLIFKFRLPAAASPYDHDGGIHISLSFDADGWKDERMESRRLDFHNCQMMSWVLAARDNGVSLFWQVGIILRQAISSDSIRHHTIRTRKSDPHWERISLFIHNNTSEQMGTFTLTSSRSYILHAAAKSMIPENYRHNRISIQYIDSILPLPWDGNLW